MLPCIAELSHKLSDISGLSTDNKDLCTLELTVTTGLEEVAAQECREKLFVEPLVYLGRIIFDISVENVSKVLKLRSVENIHLLICVNSNIQFSKEREDCFEKLYKLVNSPDWQKGIKVWQLIFGKENEEDPFKGEQELQGKFCTPKPEVDLKLMKNDCSISGNLPDSVLSSVLKKREEEKNNIKNVNKENEVSDVENTVKEEKKGIDAQRRFGGPKFRVTAHRVGSNHIFGSSEAARQFGGGINEKFGWPVDLKNFDLEVLLNIIGEFVYVCISLTKEPLFKRNLSVFGPTNLRSTICYNMVKLAKPQPGDFIVDPMCGGGSIPIEGALTYPHCFYLGGDNFEAATTRSRTNIENLVNKGNSLNIDTIRWDSTSLPFRDQVVDVVVCDLPFGKRIGSKVDNRVLYLKSLVELARVTRLNTGRAVLLTYDKRSITKGLFRVSSLWKNFSTRSINIGGLVGAIYLLQRTGILSTEGANDMEDVSKGRKRKLSSEERP